MQSQVTSKKVENGSSWWISLDNGGDENKQQLTCCGDCSTKFENEVGSLQSSSECNSESTTTSSLPPWFKPYKEDSRGVGANDKVIITFPGIIFKPNYCVQTISIYKVEN